MKKIDDFLEFLKKALKSELDINDYDDFFLGFRCNISATYSLATFLLEFWFTEPILRQHRLTFEVLFRNVGKKQKTRMTLKKYNNNRLNGVWARFYFRNCIGKKLK